MLLDEALILCENYDTVGKTNAANVTNVIDFGETTSEPGVNKRGGGYLNIQVVQSFTGGTGANLTINESADNASFTKVPGTGAIPLNGLAAGTVISLPIPAVKRYFTVKYSATATTTAGAITVWVGDKATKH